MGQTDAGEVIKSCGLGRIHKRIYDVVRCGFVCVLVFLILLNDYI